jgi:hypothetical protein
MINPGTNSPRSEQNYLSYIVNIVCLVVQKLVTSVVKIIMVPSEKFN